MSADERDVDGMAMWLEMASLVDDLGQVLDAWSLCGVGEVESEHSVPGAVLSKDPGGQVGRTPPPPATSTRVVDAGNAPRPARKNAAWSPRPAADRASVRPGPAVDEGNRTRTHLGKWLSHTGGAPVAGASRLQRLEAGVADCRRCPLAQSRRNLVFGQGNPGADLLVIGEAPGFHEDETGQPFVGQAGRMLGRMLRNVLGVDRSEVFITNVLKCRPPNNRDPLPDEVSRCLPLLEAQVEAIAPRVILTLGRVAAQTLLRTGAPLGRLRGRWAAYSGIPVMATYHPAYLLRNPSDKRKTLADLILVKKRLGALN